MSGAVIKEEDAHEGRELRKLIRRSGLTQEDFALKLGMTVQNLSYHMRKRELTDDLKRLLKEKGIIPFSKSENEPENIENGVIPYNIPLKGKRMAKVLLPHDSTAKDIEILMSHLKLMKDSMD